MKTTQHRTAHRSAAGTRGIDHGTGADRTVGFPGRSGPGPETDGFGVRFDVVVTHQSADPFQIPWLEEISGGPGSHDAFSGVI